MTAGTIYVMLSAMLPISNYTWLMIYLSLKRLLFFFFFLQFVIHYDRFPVRNGRRTLMPTIICEITP